MKRGLVAQSDVWLALVIVLAVAIAGCNQSDRVAKNDSKNDPKNDPPKKEQVSDESPKVAEAKANKIAAPGDDVSQNDAEEVIEKSAAQFSEIANEKPNANSTSKSMPAEELSAKGAENVAMQPNRQTPDELPVEANEEVNVGGETLPPSAEDLADSNDLPTEPVKDDSEDTSTESTEVPHDRFRALLPTTAGVLVVDFDVRIGEFDLTQMHADRIDEVISDAAGGDDKDSAKELTWRKLFEHVGGDPANFGRNMVQPDQYKDMTRRYDSNLNKQPDHDEVAKFLFRNAGFGGPFRLKGTHHYRQINRSRSQIFTTLDRDGDRVLDPDELSIASELLLRLDQNGDRRIDLSETASTERDDESAWKRRNSNRLGEVAMDLEGFIDWSMVSYSLGGFALHSPFGIDDGAVAQIDSDGNGEISKSEAEHLRDVEADLELIVRFADEVAAKPTFEVARCAAELDSMIALAPGARAVSVTGQSLRMIFRADDAEGGEERVPPEIFAMLDANADGGIDEDEFPDVGNDEFSFERLDANDDGKVTLSEINGRGRRPTAIWNAQVRARASESPDALFSWLDWNQDGYLSEREISAAPRRLSGGRDESIAAIDLPDAFVVHLIRGDPSQDERNFEPPAVPLRPSMTIPRWAVEMDSNRDGEISRLEFIGTAEQFAKLDQNADGFVTPNELPKKTSSGN